MNKLYVFKLIGLLTFMVLTIIIIVYLYNKDKATLHEYDMNNVEENLNDLDDEEKLYKSFLETDEETENHKNNSIINFVPYNQNIDYDPNIIKEATARSDEKYKFLIMINKIEIITSNSNIYIFDALPSEIKVKDNLLIHLKLSKDDYSLNNSIFKRTNKGPYRITIKKVGNNMSIKINKIIYWYNKKPKSILIVKDNSSVKLGYTRGSEY